MRPVGILLALLSAAALPWSEAAVTEPSSGRWMLPIEVTLTIEVFQGKEFKKLPKYQEIVKDVLVEADQMLRKFTEKYNTIFTVSRVFSDEVDDSNIKFSNLEKKSNDSTRPNVNMYVYFTNNADYKPNIRKWELRGKMCDADKGYRTLLLNQYDFYGRKQSVTRLAKIFAYYVGMLLGMVRDPRKPWCVGGFMDYRHWGRGEARQHWNNCNARDLSKFYAGFIKADQSAIRQCASIFRLPPLLKLTVAAFYDSTFNCRASNCKETYRTRSTAIPGIIQTAENLLNKDEELGIRFKLQLTGPISTPRGIPTYDKTTKATRGRSENLFVFFTKNGFYERSVMADPDMAGKICDSNKIYRSFVFDQDHYYNFAPAGPSGHFTEDGLAMNLAYYIARSIGIRYDNGRDSPCDDGPMNSLGPGKPVIDRGFFRYWNRAHGKVHWNKCNAEEMKAKVREQTCLTTE